METAFFFTIGFVGFVFTLFSFSKRTAHHKKVVLDLLKTHKELTGLEILLKSQGWLKRGTVYMVLRELEEDGLICSRSEDAMRPDIEAPHRIYSFIPWSAP